MNGGIELKFEEKTLSSEQIFQGNLIDLFVKKVELPNGKTSTREIIVHSGAVAIMPITTEGKMVFVEQFRKPIEKTILEIPAGKIDATDAHPEEAGVRELEEETGYQADSFEFLKTFYTTPGFTDEVIHLYKATGLKKQEIPLTLDEDEFLEIKELSFEEAWQAYEEGKIIDAKTIMALLYWKIELLTAIKKDE